MQQAETTPPSLFPTASIPLFAYDDGSISSPALDFAPDERVLYVRQAVELHGWLWHAPNLAVGALVIGLAALVWVALRYRKREQVRGRVYCRRCNYELTPPLAQLGADGRVEVLAVDGRCPECGVGLGSRPPIRGRPRWRRAWPFVVAGIGLVIGAAVTLDATLEPYRPMPGWPTPPWPGKWVVSMAPKLALQRSEKIGRHEHQRISRWRLEDGQRAGGLGVYRVWGFDNGRLSADGRWYALIEQPEAWAEYTLVLIDTRAGRARRAGLGGHPVGGLAGFSKDGRSIDVQRCEHDVSAATCEIILDRYDLATLSPTEIAREKITLTKDPASGYLATPNYYYLVDERPDGMRWTLVTVINASGSPIAAEVRTGGGWTRQEFRLTLAGTSFYPPRLVDDGQPVEVPQYPPGAVSRIDLRTGELKSPYSAVLNRTMHPDGRRSVSSIGRGFKLVDEVEGRTIATLEAGFALTMADLPRISADGRWVACSVFNSPLTNRNAVGSRPCIYVWDLDQLPRTPAEVPPR